MSCPPFKGGQGRDSHSVRKDGTPSLLTVLAFVALVLMLASRCSQ